MITAKHVLPVFAYSFIGFLIYLAVQYPQDNIPSKEQAQALAAKGTVELVRFKTEADRYGVYLSINGSIKNTTADTVRNPTITCNVKANNGSVISSYNSVLYRDIEAGKTVSFSNLPAGYSDPQMAKVGCKVSSF